ncbi:MAG: HPr(Ser) kinase/phosphatase, partial [Gemmatimonadetes bacterium]|nr:HPr(Ser) kinase/phosphatase [Gemmatimonadota bacterium]
MATLTLKDLLAQKGESLQLEALTGNAGLERVLTVPEASSPGLVLAGFTSRFMAKRAHVLGETEVAYLKALPPA